MKNIKIGKATYGPCSECNLNKRLRLSGYCWDCAWRNVGCILEQIKEDADIGDGLNVFDLAVRALKITKG